MHKLTFLLGASFLFTLLLISPSAKASFYDRDEDGYVLAIKQSTMVVVLQDVDSTYLAELIKKKKTDEVTTYQNSIKTYNENIKAVVSKYFTAAKDIMFKTMGDITEMPIEQRETCSFLVYDRSMRRANNGGFYSIPYDFYTNNKKTLINMADAYYDRMNFECLGKNYSDDPQYRQLILYVKSYKGSDGVAMIYQYLPYLLPSKGAMAFALTAMQQRYNDMANHVKFSMKEAKLETKSLMATITRRTLLIDKEDLNSKTTEADIKANYPYNFKVVSEDDFDKAFLNKDTAYCCLLIMPLAAFPGPIGSISVKYEQDVVDPASSKIYLRNLAGVYIGTLTGGGYDAITKDHLKNIASDIEKYKN